MKKSSRSGAAKRSAARRPPIPGAPDAWQKRESTCGVSWRRSVLPPLHEQRQPHARTGTGATLEISEHGRALLFIELARRGEFYSSATFFLGDIKPTKRGRLVATARAYEFLKPLFWRLQGLALQDLEDYNEAAARSESRKRGTTKTRKRKKK